MKKAFIILGAIAAAIFIIFLFKFAHFYSIVHTSSSSANTSPLAKKEKDIFNILLLGYGGAGHEGSYLTDTVMIAHVDIKNKKVQLISIPRDLWVKVPTNSNFDFHSKINAVYQMGLFPDNYPDLSSKYKESQGAADLVKAIVHEVTGLDIDYYVALDFSGFQTAVDTIGGVTINVERGFDDKQYPIDGREDDLCDHKKDELEELEKIATESPEVAFPCRYQPVHFAAGVNTMNGQEALKYVRSRHGVPDGGDFGRARRQQLFLEAARDKVISIGFIPKIIPLMDDLKNHVRTDMGLSFMQKMFKESSSKYKIKNYVLSDENVLKNNYSPASGYILIPDEGRDRWGLVHSAISDVIAGINPSPSPTPIPQGITNP